VTPSRIPLIHCESREFVANQSWNHAHIRANLAYPPRTRRESVLILREPVCKSCEWLRIRELSPSYQSSLGGPWSGEVPVPIGAKRDPFVSVFSCFCPLQGPAILCFRVLGDPSKHHPEQTKAAARRRSGGSSIARRRVIMYRTIHEYPE